MFRPMMLGPLSGGALGFGWDAADPSWTISGDRTTVTRGAGTQTTLARSNTARSSGPASFTVTPSNSIAGNGNTAVGVGLFPTTAALTGTALTDALIWYKGGVVRYNGASLTVSNSTYGQNSILKFTINSDGTLTLRRDGTLVLSNYALPSLLRTPGAVASESGPILLINGAPAGETAWG